MSIFVPRKGIVVRHNGNIAINNARLAIANICIKVPFHDYVISIACDDSCGVMADLARSDIRVEHGGKDVTHLFLEEDENAIYASGDTLLRVMQKIESMKS